MNQSKQIAYQLRRKFGTQRKAADALGISESNLSQSLKYLSDNFIDKLKNLGIEIEEPQRIINKGITINNSSDETKEIKAELERLKLENMYLKEIKELMQQKIDKLEKRG